LVSCTTTWDYKYGEVFIGQGKYVVNILQKFGMMDCKSMTNPMVTYLRKLRDFDSDPVDSSLYWQLIGSLMYLVNTRPDIYGLRYVSNSDIKMLWAGSACELVESVPGGT
jgi:hypothetical protein